MSFSIQWEISRLLIGFIFVVVAIFVTSFLFTEGVKEVSKRFKLSQTFVGVSILSIATSFPEFINSIVAGLQGKLMSVDTTSLETKRAVDSFYNLTGANMLQNVFLSAVTLGMTVHLYKNKINKQQFLEFNSYIIHKKYVLWTLIVSESVLLLITLFWGNFITFGGICLTPVIFVIIWIAYFYISSRPSHEVSVETNNDKNIFSNLDNKKFFLIAIPVWIFFAFLSYANFYLITELTEKLNISKNVSFGFLLGLITSIPEFSAFFFLFKKKNYELATAGLFGSSLFNMCLLLMTNLIDPNWFMNNLQGAIKTKIILWILTDLSINLLLFASSHRAKTIYRPIVMSGILVNIYITSLVGLSYIQLVPGII